MKQRNRARSSSLFLTELIIAILFFTVCSAVCVQFFAKSHTMSQQAQELNFAVDECSAVAELIQASDSGMDISENLTAVYPECDYAKTMFPSQFMICFDSDFRHCSSSDMNRAYCLSVEIKQKDRMVQCSIAAFPADGKATDSSGNDTIYDLEIKHNLQEVAQ